MNRPPFPQELAPLDLVDFKSYRELVFSFEKILGRNDVGDVGIVSKLASCKI